jgi:small nuclear ribonucleoprotein (snRNP)-like protein
MALRASTTLNPIKENEMSNSNNTLAPGQNKTVTIIINGRPREVIGKMVSYEETVKLAFPDDPSNQDADFTVAYANPHGKDGELVAGQEVHVKEGMVFNVTKTNRS